MRISGYFLCVILSFVISLTGYSDIYSDDAVTRNSLVRIHPGIQLEVIEWCSEGRPLVFLAGLGHAAYVFDEFAPRFCDKYRVVGITRRGYGGSSVPDTGFDLATLADDIRIVLDSLRIDKAILVGHSLGGDEMTRFAGLFPDRVKALIYLDAAHDRVATRDSLKNYPEPASNYPQPTEDDLASLTAFREYYFKVNGVRLPESEFLSICNWNEDGSFGGWKGSGGAYRAISENLEHPDYSKIKAPALAIYGVDYPITELYMDFVVQDSLVQCLQHMWRIFGLHNCHMLH